MIFIFPPKKIKHCNALGESHSPHPDSNSSGWEDYGYYIVTKPLHAPCCIKPQNWPILPRGGTGHLGPFLAPLAGGLQDPCTWQR